MCNVEYNSPFPHPPSHHPGIAQEKDEIAAATRQLEASSRLSTTQPCSPVSTNRPPTFFRPPFSGGSAPCQLGQAMRGNGLQGSSTFEWSNPEFPFPLFLHISNPPVYFTCSISHTFVHTNFCLLPCLPGLVPPHP